MEWCGWTNKFTCVVSTAYILLLHLDLGCRCTSNHPVKQQAVLELSVSWKKITRIKSVKRNIKEKIVFQSRNKKKTEFLNSYVARAQTLCIPELGKRAVAKARPWLNISVIWLGK